MSDKTLKGKFLGFILTFFLGLIGLVLALCLGDEDCKKVAAKTFIVLLIIEVVVIILYFIGIAAALVGSIY